MNLDRRDFVSLSAASGVSMLLPGRRAQAQESVGLADRFLSHFSGEGAQTLEQLPLITESPFNGGLRYDDTRPSYPDAFSVCVQPACRVEDAEKVDVPGVRALFHIMAFNLPTPLGPQDTLSMLLTFAVEAAQLDPEKLVFVSTELFEPYLEQVPLAQKGRFVKRSLSEARAAGDGSGFFAPANHPHTGGFPTASVHYPIGSQATGELEYPLPGYLELGEIALDKVHSDPSSPATSSIGLERLAIAGGQQAPDFEQSRVALLDKIQQEVSVSGKQLPTGIKAFAD